MVANGMGLTLLPEMSLGVELAHGNVEVHRFAPPEPARTVGLAWRKGSARRADFEALGEMIKADIRVPPGFAVTTDSYLEFITAAEIKDKIYSRLVDLNPENVAALNQASQEVQEMIKTAAIPDASAPFTSSAFADRNRCAPRACA